MTRLSAHVATARPRGRTARFGLGSSAATTFAAIVLGSLAAAFAAVVATELSSPLPLVVLLAGAAALVVAGPELCACVAILLGCGLLPFLAPMDVPFVLPWWLLGFLAACGLMVATAIARWLGGEPVARSQVGALLWLALALLLYAALRLAQSAPMDVPSAAAPFVALPLAALVTYLWLMHDRTVQRVQRLLPFVIAIVTAWTLAYIGGASGQCAQCTQYVGTLATGEGLLGDGSRLYTWGQEAQLVFIVLALALALFKPRKLWISLAALGVICLLLQNSRMQEVAVFGGFLVLLVWRLYHVPVVTKLLFVALTAFAVYAILSSSVGANIVSGYEGLREGSGTGGYRLGLLDSMRNSWSALGLGVSYGAVDRGYDLDLGIPNTILLLGFVGAALQLALLFVGVGRALLVRSEVGTALAAVLVMVLLARPSLPLLETGTGAVAVGVVIGVIASLYVRSGAERALERRPRHALGAT